MISPGAGSLNPISEAAKLLEAIPLNPPCAILMEIALPDISGIECAWRLKRLLLASPIVVHTARSEPRVVLLSVLAGADGYLAKPAAPRNIADLLVRAMRGAPALCAQAENSLLEALRRAGRTPAFGPLSTQEWAVFGALIEGLPDKEIADSLGISARTAQAHLLSIYRKLGVHRREQARRTFLGALCGTQAAATGPSL